MGYGGSIDYYDLFEPDARWPRAAGHVQVFKVPGTWVHYYSTDEELRTVVNGVAERGMALALELGPLTVTAECDQGEGFGGHYELDAVRRIHRVGGRVDVVALDEPYAFGHVETTPNPCHYPPERVAQEIADFVRALRKIAPDVVVGDIEPMWTDITADDLATWLDTYRHVAGEPFAFLHLDADWSRHDWPEAFLATEQAARERGVPIGVIYNGSEAQTDAEWNGLAMDRAYSLEQVTGGRPDHVIFQSWFDHPDRVLPETDPTTFTGLVNRYLGTRSAISITRSRDSVTGAITAGGAALADASLTVHALPLDGPAQSLRLEGRVPDDARRAVVGIRVNTEGAGPGPTDITLYGIGYTEGSETANRVPNARFRAGLDDSGGTGRATLKRSDRGRGVMLRMVARPTQWLNINTRAFKVTSGADYHLIALARIPARSAGSAYLAVIFLADGESVRHRMELAPGAIELGEVTSDPSGSFVVSPGALGPGRYLIRVSYAGAAGRWPARAEEPFTVK